MRNMSFSLTTQQVLEQTKLVTRRFGWSFLQPGDLVQPVRKAMGLKKSERIEKLGGAIGIVSVRAEPLACVTKHECVLEGFPELDPAGFIGLLQDHYGRSKVSFETVVNRIEYTYMVRVPRQTYAVDPRELRYCVCGFPAELELISSRFPASPWRVWCPKCRRLGIWGRSREQAMGSWNAGVVHHG